MRSGGGNIKWQGVPHLWPIDCKYPGTQSLSEILQDFVALRQLQYCHEQ